MSFVFDPDLCADDTPVQAPAAPVTSVAPVTAAVTTVPVAKSAITTAPITAAAYMAKPPTAWNWRDVRDYVVAQILRYNPELLPRRDEAKEYGIFSSFATRWGRDAGSIARFAFEDQSSPGMWMNAPIGLGRFAKASDPLFAQVIVDKHLRQH